MLDVERWAFSSSARCSPVLFIADVLHPLDDFSVERFLNGDMRHRSRRRRAVPMLRVRRKPDDVTRPDFLDRTALALRPSDARRDDQRLTERMCMPGGARARLERNACATHTRRFGRLEKRVNAHRAGKIFSRPFT